MRDIIDNPMNEYARIAKYLKNPAIKIDKLAQYAQGANPKVPEFLASGISSNVDNASSYP